MCPAQLAPGSSTKEAELRCSSLWMTTRPKGRRGGDRSRMRGWAGHRSRVKSLGLWVAAPAAKRGLRGWKEETRMSKVLVFSMNLHSRAADHFHRSIWLFPPQLQLEFPCTWCHWWGRAHTRSSYNILISPLCPLGGKHQFWRHLLFF